MRVAAQPRPTMLAARATANTTDGTRRLKPSEYPSAVAQIASSTALISNTTQAIQLTTLSPTTEPTSSTNMAYLGADPRSLPVPIAHSTVRLAPMPTHTA